jgi:hypothetical protein
VAIVFALLARMPGALRRRQADELLRGWTSNIRSDYSRTHVRSLVFSVGSVASPPPDCLDLSWRFGLAVS